MLRSIISLLLSVVIAQLALADTLKSDGDLRIITLNGSNHKAVFNTDSIGLGKMILDFTSFPIKGDATAQYIMSGDSMAMELMPEVRFDFVRSGNGLPALVCIEGRTWKATIDSLPINGHSQRRDSCSMSKDLSLTLRLRGLSQQTLNLNQTLITPQADTLRTIKMLSISFDGEIIRQSDPEWQRPIQARRTYWIRPGAEFPTAVATTLNGSIVSLYYFDSAETTGGIDRQSTARIASNPPLPTSIISQSTQPDDAKGITGFYPGKKLNDRVSEPDITIDRGTITVNIPDQDANFNIMLCDLLGRTIPSTANSPSQLIFQNLLTGDYILTITTPHSNLSHKLYIP